MPLRTDLGCLYCSRPDIVLTRRFLFWPPPRHVLPRCNVSVVLDNYRRNATAAFPSPPDAAIQLLDSTARNSLICMALICGLCGLRAGLGERGRSEEWPGESGMWRGAENSGGWRSPQTSAGTPKNTREPARSGKKKPQPRTVGASLLVETAGIEPASANPRPVSSTCVVCLRFRPSPSDRQDGYGLSLLGFNGAVTGAPRHDPAYMTVSSKPAGRTRETVSGD